MEYYRAVVDLNRAPDDTAPENPDGVVKSHTCWNVPVYKPGSLPDEKLKNIIFSFLILSGIISKIDSALRRRR